MKPTLKAAEHCLEKLYNAEVDALNASLFVSRRAALELGYDPDNLPQNVFLLESIPED